MSLRIAMLTTFYPPYNFGGDGIGIQRLCHGLARRGHEVTVIHDADAYRLLAKDGEPAPVEHPRGVTVHALSSGSGFLSSLWTQQLGRPAKGRRIRALLDTGFDVINFHNVSLLGGPGLLKYGDAVKLYMAHEHWLVCPTHVLWRHMRERCDGRECLRCQISYRRPPQLWRATGYLEREAKHVDTFIAMSRFSRDKHREFGFSRDMEVLSYFLPDTEDEAPPTPEGKSPHERPYVLFVGRLEKIKGLDDVIPLFRERDDVDLLIAGDGEYAETLRGIAGGADSVRFLGRVDPDDLARYYRHALALVVPSVCFETFGIILIEAFRHGTPVVARRLGPFPEIVEEARAGELFSDTDEMAAALERLLGSPELRATYGRNGWEAYRRNWCESAVIPRYLDLVRAAAERRGAAEVVAKLETSSEVTS